MDTSVLDIFHPVAKELFYGVLLSSVAMNRLAKPSSELTEHHQQEIE